MVRLAALILIISLAVNPEFAERAKPYASWLLNPAYEWSTRSRVAEIARALDAEESRGRPRPTSATLPQFLVAHYARPDAATDSWGTRYFLVRDTWTTRVASAGADRTPNTSDDILSRPLHAAAF